MIKTSKQVQGDVYRLLRNSTLSSMISGDVYRSGQRPKDSILEDAVVIFTAGRTKQIQTGIVTINIFVPDFDVEGVMTEDSDRTEELEVLAQQWVDSLTADKSNYIFELEDAIATDVDEQIKQHFIVVRLHYKILE